MKSLSLCLLFGALLTGLGATPVPSVSEEAQALGASLERWAQAQGLDGWTCRLESNRSPEVGRWPLTVTFLAGPGVTKARVDEAELAFYPWFRKTAPGLVPEAKFTREEAWQGTFEAPGYPVGPEEFYRGPMAADGLSQARIEWTHDPDAASIRSVRVVWTWPADLSPAQEAAEALDRQKRQNQFPAAWTRVPLPSPGFGAQAWSERIPGGAALADALDRAYRTTAQSLGVPENRLTYSLSLGRGGFPVPGEARTSPWYPDQIRQRLGFSIDAMAPLAPVTWDQWTGVRKAWGPSPVDVEVLYRISFDTRRIPDLEAWRKAAQDDLQQSQLLRLQGWTWGPEGAPPGTEMVEVALDSQDPEVVEALKAFHRRNQP